MNPVFCEHRTICDDLSCRGAACCAPTKRALTARLQIIRAAGKDLCRVIRAAANRPGGLLLNDGADEAWIERLCGGGFARQRQELRRSTVEHFRLEEGAGEGAERGAEAGAERGEKSATGVARSVGADVEQLRGNAQGAGEEIRVDAEEAGEALQRGHLALKRRVGEGQLVFLCLASFGNSLLAREFVGELAEAGGVARAGQTILCGLLERIESAGQRALRLSGDGCFVGRAQAGIVQNALILREEQVASLLLLAEKLLVQ